MSAMGTDNRECGNLSFALHTECHDVAFALNEYPSELKSLDSKIITAQSKAAQ